VGGKLPRGELEISKAVVDPEGGAGTIKTEEEYHHNIINEHS